MSIQRIRDFLLLMRYINLRLLTYLLLSVPFGLYSDVIKIFFCMMKIANVDILRWPCFGILYTRQQ